MPTYEYVCSSCGNAWEELQKITEAATETCPKCGKPTAKRQISGGNFILKGGGWYADLYSSARPESKSDASGGAGKGDGKSDKAESKSETKSEGGAAASSLASTPSTSGSGTSSGSGGSTAA